MEFSVKDVPQREYGFCPFGSNNAKHELVFASSGKGRSVLTEQARLNARNNGHFLIDTELYREGRGLLPYEHEYTRRLALGLTGELPRSLRRVGKTIIISDTSRPQKKKFKQWNPVRTKNNIVLDRELIASAVDGLEWVSGVTLNQPQLISLLEDTGMDETLFEYDEVETTFRESLADALSMRLLGKPWPTYGANSDFSEFMAQLNAKAKLFGYQVNDN